MSFAAFKKHAQEMSETTFQNNSTVPEGFPTPYFYDADTAQLVSFMHDLDKFVPIVGHSIKVAETKSGKPIFRTEICGQVWTDMGIAHDPCKRCGEIDPTTGNEYKKVKFLAGCAYVHTAEPDDKRGAFRIIEQKPGKDRINHLELESISRSGYFVSMEGKPTVIKLGKTGKGINTTYVMPSVVAPIMLGPGFSGEIPLEVQDKMTPPEGVDLETLVGVYALANYDNVPYEKLGIPTPQQLAEQMAAKPKKVTSMSAKLGG